MGNLGGVFGAAEKCQIDFPDSRMCNVREVEETTAIPAGADLPPILVPAAMRVRG